MDPYSIDHSGHQCSVKLAGDLTAAIVPDLLSALRKQIQPETQEVSFDLTAVSLLDSTGIGLLIAAYNTLRPREGKVSVTGVSPYHFQVLQSMRLVTRLNVTPRAT